jgi:hypothetical protein
LDLWFETKPSGNPAREKRSLVKELQEMQAVQFVVNVHSNVHRQKHIEAINFRFQPIIIYFILTYLNVILHKYITECGLALN